MSLNYSLHRHLQKEFSPEHQLNSVSQRRRAFAHWRSVQASWQAQGSRPLRGVFGQAWSTRLVARRAAASNSFGSSCWAAASETQSQRIMLPRIDAAPGDPFGQAFEVLGSNVACWKTKLCLLVCYRPLAVLLRRGVQTGRRIAFSCL